MKDQVFSPNDVNAEVAFKMTAGAFMKGELIRKGLKPGNKMMRDRGIAILKTFTEFNWRDTIDTWDKGWDESPNVAKKGNKYVPAKGDKRDVYEQMLDDMAPTIAKELRKETDTAMINSKGMKDIFQTRINHSKGGGGKSKAKVTPEFTAVGDEDRMLPLRAYLRIVRSI